MLKWTCYLQLIHLRGVWAWLLLHFSYQQSSDIHLFLQLQSLFNLNDKRKPCVVQCYIRTQVPFKIIKADRERERIMFFHFAELIVVLRPPLHPNIAPISLDNIWNWPQASFPALALPPWGSDCRRSPPDHPDWGWPPLTFPSLILESATWRGRFYCRGKDLPLWAASPHSTWNWVDYWGLVWSGQVSHW